MAIEDEIHETLDKFLDSLEKVFGPGRSSNFYRGQLSTNYKKKNEHILDYIGRIKELRNCIIEGEQLADQNNLDRTLNSNELSLIDSFMLESFYEGLPPNYRSEVRTEGYNNLTEAYSEAIIVSKRFERGEIRFRNNRPINNTRNSPATSSQ